MPTRPPGTPDLDLTYDGASGTLSRLGSMPSLPAGVDRSGNTGSDVRISPSGRFLYGSNRGHDSIVIYAIAPDGTLTLQGHESTRGRIPRNFEVSPDGAFLAAANQDTSDIFTFRIDQATGLLSWTGQKAVAGTPICVRFL